MRQTAIQEMINEFNKELNVATQIGNEDKIRITKHLINIASKYLEMEKEQIINTYRDGRSDQQSEKPSRFYNRMAEQYYNETFKSE
jgi:hypothetical protein